MTTSDPYANKVTLGALVREAAGNHDDSDPDMLRLNDIIACEAFINGLTDLGCMITRIPTGKT